MIKSESFLTLHRQQHVPRSTTFKAQKGSKGNIKLVLVISVVQPKLREYFFCAKKKKVCWHCHSHVLESPSQQSEGTLLDYCLCYSGLQFPSPLALIIVPLPSAVCNLGSLPPVYFLCGLCLWLLKLFSVVFLYSGLHCVFTLFFPCF